MSIKVDKEKCIGCGACAATCPSGFEMKESKAVAKGNQPCSKQAQDVCPVSAISGA